MLTWMLVLGNPERGKEGPVRCPGDVGPGHQTFRWRSAAECCLLVLLTFNHWLFAFLVLIGRGGCRVSWGTAWMLVFVSTAVNRSAWFLTRTACLLNLFLTKRVPPPPHPHPTSSKNSESADKYYSHTFNNDNFKSWSVIQTKNILKKCLIIEYDKRTWFDFSCCQVFCNQVVQSWLVNAMTHTSSINIEFQVAFGDGSIRID